MKRKTATAINAAFWIILAVALMVGAYFAWSKNGSYTVGSFLASLLMHGGVCALFGAVFHNAIMDSYER